MEREDEADIGRDPHVLRSITLLARCQAFTADSRGVLLQTCSLGLTPTADGRLGAKAVHAIRTGSSATRIHTAGTSNMNSAQQPAGDLLSEDSSEETLAESLACEIRLCSHNRHETGTCMPQTTARQQREFPLLRCASI